jgi:hypothetical protein
MIFPKHKAGLYITHNDHLASYDSVKDYMERIGYEDTFISHEEYEKAIELNDYWCIQWYPETPIGFNVVCATTFEKALEYALKEENK